MSISRQVVAVPCLLRIKYKRDISVGEVEQNLIAMDEGMEFIPESFAYQETPRIPASKF